MKNILVKRSTIVTNDLNIDEYIVKGTTLDIFRDTWLPKDLKWVAVYKDVLYSE
jgi:hypothetical protein